MGANVTVNCVHPGIVRTRLNRDRDGVLTGETTTAGVTDNELGGNMNAMHM